MNTRLELYVRSLSASEARAEQETVVEQLATLVDRDLIGEYSVHVRGEELCPTGVMAESEPGQATLELVSEFQAWAEAAGRSLTPLFERRTVHRPLSDEGSRLVIKLPVEKGKPSPPSDLSSTNSSPESTTLRSSRSGNDPSSWMILDRSGRTVTDPVSRARRRTEGRPYPLFPTGSNGPAG
jgi:hypothetical protein